MLKSEAVESSSAQLGVVTTYDYDAYGNKKSASTANVSGASGNAVFTTRTSTSLYAAYTVTVAGTSVGVPAGLFATTATNALNQSEQRIYDPRFGALLSRTVPNDSSVPNSLTTSWVVDDFGRTVRETRPDNNSTVSYYCYIGQPNDASHPNSPSSPNCPAPSAGETPTDAYFYVHTEPHNSADAKNGAFSRVYSDRAGRKIRTVTESYDGGSQASTPRLIVQDAVYSQYGPQTTATQPYFLDGHASTSSGTTLSGSSYTTYDQLGRPTGVYTVDAVGTHTAPTGVPLSGAVSRTLISYAGLNTTTTNDLGQTRLEEKGVDGKVFRTTDALGAQMAFQSDAFGNLVVTKDPLGNQITVAYDLRGRKVSMSDPDTGLWAYDYDALGELRWQQSPNERAASQAPTTMTYDQLGRMKTRVDPEYTSTWSYDTCGNGVGKLCSVAATNGLTRQYVYDALGRPLNTLSTVTSGPTFASAVSYDANGRLATQTYPSGLTVNYGYTAKGFLSALTLGTQASVTPLPSTPGGSAVAGTTLNAGSVLWQALAYNAWGKPEQQSVGNGVATTATYDAVTGRLLTQTAGASNAVLNQGYTWDSLNRLTQRKDLIGDGASSVSEDFHYDGINRLTNYQVNSAAIASNQRSVDLQYNAAGLLLYKTDVGDYVYPTQGGARPHALVQSINQGGATSYVYDANGNLTSANGGTYRTISYTSFNLPDAQAGIGGSGFAGSAVYGWQYDENHARLKEVRTVGGKATTTWSLHPDNQGGLGFESETANGVTSNRHFLSVGGQAIGVLVSTGAVLAPSGTKPASITSITLVKVEYWHKDHLGSLTATTDHAGNVTARYAYDPFGKRRQTNGGYDAQGSLIADWSANTNHGTGRGFTGHEELDDLGLVHMNGRIFDPTLGRFLQGDPMVQDALNLQNYNRYGYCFNSPMGCTDMSGLCFLGCFWQPHHWPSWVRPVLAIAVGIALGPEVGFAAQGYTIGGVAVSGIGQAAIAGFAAGAISSGNIEGAIQGGLTAAAFFEVGTVVGKVSSAGKFAESVALHAVVGCVSTAAGGGRCGSGALSASFADAVAQSGAMGGINAAAANGDRVALVEGVTISAVIGGTGSVLGGGKFANGAQTGAFGYLFNSIAHSLTPVAFTTDGGQPVLDINGNPMMRPSDVDPRGEVARGEAFGPAVGALGLQNFRIGGDWDWQRVGSERVFVGTFTDFANVSIGLYSAAAGIPESAVLDVANRYAAKNSNFSGSQMDATYLSLRVQNVYDIRLGYQLYKSGAITSNSPRAETPIPHD